MPKGGPDGGDGGSGGDVWLQADRNVASLLAFRDHPHRRASRARTAAGKKRHGASGDDLVVDRPRGHGRADARRRAARRPRAPRRPLPRRRTAAAAGAATPASSRTPAARPASPSRASTARSTGCASSCKLLADAALVGFPNAGQVDADLRGERGEAQDRRLPVHHARAATSASCASATTSSCSPTSPGSSRARPRAAGLGHQFLRHVERARVLVLLLDLASVDGRTPEEQERVLLDELGRYRPELLERPRLVVGTQGRRRDVELHDPTGCASRRSRATGSTSSSAGSGTLVDEARADGARAPSRSSCSARSRRASPSCATTTARGGSPAAPPSGSSRWPTSPTTRRIAYVQDRLRRMGVERALARAGAREGDIVRIGPVELEYVEGHLADARSPSSRSGTSSITSDARRARRRRAAEAVRASSPTARDRGPRGRARVARARSPPACPRSGWPRRPTDIGTLQAVAAVGQPRLMERFGAILGRARARRRPGAAHAARLRHAHAVPARPRDAAAPARPRRGPGRQRERHRRRRRDPLRRQRPARRARVAPRRAPTCSCCSPTPPGLFTADPRLDAGGVAHRGDRRGRRRARGGRRRHRHRRGGAAGWRASSRRRRSRRGRACAR